MHNNDTDTRRAGPPKTLEELGCSGASVARKAPDPDAVLREALRAEAPAQGLWKRTLQWVVAGGVTALLA